MYNDLFDHDNRMNEIQSKKGTIHRKGTHQTGEFDKHILCQTCDNDIIGKLDRYASLILRSWGRIGQIGQNGGWRRLAPNIITFVPDMIGNL